MLNDLHLHKFYKFWSKLSNVYFAQVEDEVDEVNATVFSELERKLQK